MIYKAGNGLVTHRLQSWERIGYGLQSWEWIGNEWFTKLGMDWE